MSTSTGVRFEYGVRRTDSRPSCPRAFRRSVTLLCVLALPAAPAAATLPASEHCVTTVVPSPTLSTEYGTPVDLEIRVCGWWDLGLAGGEAANAQSFTVRAFTVNGMRIVIPEIGITIRDLDRAIKILERLARLEELDDVAQLLLLEDVNKALVGLIPGIFDVSAAALETIIQNIESGYFPHPDLAGSCNRRATISLLRHLWGLVRFSGLVKGHLDQMKHECKLFGLLLKPCYAYHLWGIYVDLLSMKDLMYAAVTATHLVQTVDELTQTAEEAHLGTALTEGPGHETVARRMKLAGLRQAELGARLRALDQTASWEISYPKSVIPPSSYRQEALETSARVHADLHTHQECLWHVTAPRNQNVMSGPRLALAPADAGGEGGSVGGDDLLGDSSQPQYLTQRMNFLAETVAIDRVIEINFVTGTIDVVDRDGRTVLDEAGTPLAERLPTHLRLEPATWGDPGTTHAIQLCHEPRVPPDPNEFRATPIVREADREIQTTDTRYWLTAGDLHNDPPVWGNWSTSVTNQIGVEYFGTSTTTGPEIRTQLVCDDDDLDDDGIVAGEADWQTSGCIRPPRRGQAETPWQERKLERSWIQAVQFSEMGGVTAAPAPDGSSDHSCGMVGISAIGKPAHVDRFGNWLPNTLGVEVRQTQAWLGMLGPFTDNEGEVLELGDYEVADPAQQLLIRLVTELRAPDPSCWEWKPEARRYEKKLDCVQRGSGGGIVW